MSTPTPVYHRKPTKFVPRFKRYAPPLALLAPSIILIGIFVYYLIFRAAHMSMTNMETAEQAAGNAPVEFVGLDNYVTLLRDQDFQHSLLNLLLYTVVFIGGTMVLGFFWAWLLDRRSKAEGIFRSLFLFPFAVSSIAAGVVWKWLLNPIQGADATGVNRLFQTIGLGGLQNGWTNSPDNAGSPGIGIIAVAIPAIWQMAGYVMALFLAGFRGISNEMREAARVDGATEWQLYRHVLFPQLSPVALSALIILGHMSLKVFDLVMALTGHAVYATQVPAITLYNFFKKSQYGSASAVGIILLVIIAIVIIPYLIHIAREDK
ncbi:MAG: sugar ABC transporter permease [Propionibacteriaceae bacterium]|nr:sugar ABC transporter permease [Propionibacteriaceae bacterium]